MEPSICPDIIDEIMIKYGGQQGAAKDRVFVAFGRDTIEVLENAGKLGYTVDDVWLIDIPRLGVIYAGGFRVVDEG